MHEKCAEELRITSSTAIDLKIHASVCTIIIIKPLVLGVWQLHDLLSRSLDDLWNMIYHVPEIN